MRQTSCWHNWCNQTSEFYLEKQRLNRGICALHMFQLIETDVNKTDVKNFHIWETFVRRHKLQSTPYPAKKESVLFYIKERTGVLATKSMKRVLASMSKHPVHRESNWLEDVLHSDEVTEAVQKFARETIMLKGKSPHHKREYEKRIIEALRKEREHMHIVEGPTQKGTAAVRLFLPFIFLIIIIHGSGYMISTAPKIVPSLPKNPPNDTHQLQHRRHDTSSTFKRNASKSPKVRIAVSSHKSPTVQEILKSPRPRIIIARS